MSKERKWGTWAGVWRTLAVGLDGARIISIRGSLLSPFTCSNQISMRRSNRYPAPRRRVASATLRYNGEVTAEVGITAFHPPFSTVSSLAAKFCRTPSRNTSSNLYAALAFGGLWVGEMVKRWKESFTTISGRGWSQGFEAILKMVIWGGIPSTISCGAKLKNGVGDVVALWDT